MSTNVAWWTTATLWAQFRSEGTYIRIMQRWIIALTAATALYACGDGKADAAREYAESKSELDHVPVDLSVFDMPLVLHAPLPQDAGGAAPVVVFNENTGKLEVRVGERFALSVVEDEVDFARLKADLDREQVRTTTVISEAPDRLVYRSEFPDEPQLVYIHFYRAVESGGRSFIVEDLQEEVRFNEQDVERMIDAVLPATPQVPA